MKKKYNFKDINLIPKKCIVNSRSECNTEVTLGKFKFKIPVIPSNMECVINEDISKKLVSNGYFYVMHRFEVNQIEFIKSMKNENYIASISIGVNEDSYKLIDDIVELKKIDKNLYPDFITIDIAHGHSIKMENMIKYIKNNIPECFIIAGNVSTKDAVIDLQNWGADAIKVGIGPGSSCTTWNVTGFGSRNCQAQIINECSSVSNVPIIADGGIKTPSDITKSLVMGASAVMIGGMMSGFKDSPGKLVQIDGLYKKEFYGSASKNQSGKKNRIEGKKILIDYKDISILDQLIYLEECLQSSISYAGGNDLKCFDDVDWF